MLTDAASWDMQAFRPWVALLPHHPTSQTFTDEQFEAYRSLGARRRVGGLRPARLAHVLVADEPSANGRAGPGLQRPGNPVGAGAP